MPHFSIVIVSYNSSDFIGECLKSLKRQSDQDFEVVIVDNASTDDSVSVIEGAVDGLPASLIIESNKNLGFAAGCNRGASEARGEWLVFLNPDGAAHPDWLAEVRAGQLRHKDVSVFACTQYMAESPWKLDGVGDCYWGFGIPWRGGFDRPVADLPEEGECFSPCGASAVIRKKVFEDVSGFEERFFCYCEDVDIGFRLRRSGERCVFLPKAAIDHHGSAITGSHSEFTIYHGTRNRVWTYVRNMPLWLLVLTLPGHIAATLYSYRGASVSGNVRPYTRGLLDGIKGSVWAFRTRQKGVRPAAKSNALELLAWHPNYLRKHAPYVRSFPRITD